MNIIVRYNYVIGENEIPQTLLLIGSKSAEELVHDYFKDFFFSRTVCEKKAELYWKSDYTEAVNINGWSEVPDGDYAVLRKYLEEGV